MNEMLNTDTQYSTQPDLKPTFKFVVQTAATTWKSNPWPSAFMAKRKVVKIDKIESNANPKSSIWHLFPPGLKGQDLIIIFCMNQGVSSLMTDHKDPKIPITTGTRFSFWFNRSWKFVVEEGWVPLFDYKFPTLSDFSISSALC